MADTKIALLPDRGAVTITGEDARTLLQGLITNDMALIDTQPALYAGLLTPQGKILFDFFVVATPEGFCLEVARSKAGELVERLKMYKLRSKVDIVDASADYTVAAIWGGEYAPQGNGKPPLLFTDPRLPGMGYREMTTLRSDWALGGKRATAPRKTNITRTVSGWACRKAGVTMRSVMPSRTKRCSTSSTACRSRRAALSARKWSHGCSIAGWRGAGSFRW